MPQREKGDLDELGRKMIRPFALGLGLLYLAFSVGQYFLLPSHLKTMLFPLAVFTSLNYLVVYYFSERLLSYVSPSFIISYLCGLIYIKAAFYLILSGNIQYSPSLILIILCLSCITFSWPVFYSFLAAIWLAFGIAFYQCLDIHAGLSNLLMLAASSVLAKIVISQRIRSHLEIIRLYSQSRHVQAQELLSGSIAHELSTPLATLSLTREMLNEELQKSPIHASSVSKRMNIMNQSISQMSNLVRQLRIFAGQTIAKSKLQPLVLQEVVGSALILIKKLATENKIQITVDLPTHSLIVNADPSYLLAAFNSVITNSIEALMNSPFPRWIRILGIETNESIVITITDSGSGINKEIHKRIFEPLFSTKPNIKTGVGFGLSTARSILKRFEADIKYDESKPNTTFVIQFKKTIQTPIKNVA